MAVSSRAWYEPYRSTQHRQVDEHGGDHFIDPLEPCEYLFVVGTIGVVVDHTLTHLPVGDDLEQRTVEGEEPAVAVLDGRAAAAAVDVVRQPAVGLDPARRRQ